MAEQRPKIDPLQTQQSADLLAMALAQTSRDPQLMSQVMYSIQQRQAAAAATEVESIKQLGATQRTAIEESGAESRSRRASQTQLRSTAMAQEGAMERTRFSETAANARALLREQGETSRAGATRQSQVDSQRLETAKAITGTITDAQEFYRKLVSGDQDFVQQIMKGSLAPEAAKIMAIPESKRSDEQRQTISMFETLQGGGGLSHEDAIQLTSRFMDAQLKPYSLASETSAAMVEAAIDSFSGNFGVYLPFLLDKTPVAEEELESTSEAITTDLFSPTADFIDPGFKRAIASTAFKKMWDSHADDPQARDRMMAGVSRAILQAAAPSMDPEDIEAASAQLEAMLSDGMSLTETNTLLDLVGMDSGFRMPTADDWKGFETSQSSTAKLRSLFGQPPLEQSENYKRRQARAENRKLSQGRKQEEQINNILSGGISGRRTLTGPRNLTPSMRRSLEAKRDSILADRTKREARLDSLRSK
jgi:hypothetical protein